MRKLRLTLVLIWMAGVAAAIIYSQQKNIPGHVAVPVAIAFLVEISLFATLGRVRWDEPARLWLSGLFSWVIYSVATGNARLEQAGILVSLCAVQAGWLSIRRGLGWDLIYLGFAGVVYASGTIRSLYPEPWPGLRADALGQLMWFRLGMAAMLDFRPRERVGFGFWPDLREWSIGLRHFALFVAPGVALLLLLGVSQFRVVEGWWWKAPATFFGILWVVALAEEFFFRGILLPALSDRWGAPVGLAVSSLLFGAAHLWFRAFPNWKHALVAALLGALCGRAYLQAGSIRAAMVTHASSVALWRALFT